MGKKKGKKDLDDVEEIEYLKRGLRQAESKGDYKEVASIHNQLGNLYRLRGDYENALYHHKEEGKTVLEHEKEDQISLAIAYRNIGEVYIDKKEEERALKYLQKYLKIATKKRDLLEEQRAHITMGRLHLSLVDRYTENEDNDPDASSKREEELENAERQFRRAYEILRGEGVRGLVKEKELADMKCGTYLNLGITMDLKDKTDEALKCIDQAIALARHNGLVDNLHRCYCTIYTIKIKVENYKEALEAAKETIRAAKLKHDKLAEFEARVLQAKAYFFLDEVQSGVNTLKRLRKQIKGTRSHDAAFALLEELDPLLMAGVRILRAEDDYLASDRRDPWKLKAHYELKADNYVTLGNFQEAIRNYESSIKFAKEAGLAGKPLAALYYSLGATYKDKGDYNSAIKYFRIEMDILAGNKSEEFRTQTNIAECMERAKRPKDEVLSAFRRAAELAKGFPKKQVTAYKNLSQYYKFVRQDDLAENCTRKAEQIAKSIKNSGLDVEDDSQELNLDEDEPIDLDELSSAAESEEEEEEEGERGKNVGVARKPTKFKVNEKGETPLHVAAQKGDVKAVRRLLAQGHRVNPRDYSGWLPLHEACNFGHYEVVVELLKRKCIPDQVNDPGGEECDGTTPLLDAASNGHFACMRALLEKGANVMLKDKHGNRAIDCVVVWYDRNRESLAPEQEVEYIEMRATLCDMMKRAGKIYTTKDEQMALRRAERRSNNEDSSPRFRTIRSRGEDLPVKVVVAHPDEHQGMAGLEEYSEAMSILRRKELKKPRERRISPEKSPTKEALLAESQYVGEDWLVPDENLAPEPSTSYKRKRDPFEDLKLTDRSIRRKHEGKRNAVAQMDIVREPEPILPFERELLFDSQEQTEEDTTSGSTPAEALSGTPDEPIIDYAIPDVEPTQNEPAEVTIVSDDSDDDFRTLGSRSSRNSYSRNNSSPPPRASLSLSRKKQSKLTFTRISQTRTPRKSDEKDSEEDRIIVRRPAPLAVTRTAGTQDTLLRLKVDIMGTKILVPVTQLDQTIDWLCEEVAERHYKDSGGGMKLTISLKTKDGARLSGSDTIRIAISESDTELTAVVENSHMTELHKRFIEGLKKLGMEADEETIAALTRCETSESLILTDLPLRGKTGDVLFQCLKHHSFLREINLSGCSLYDDGITKLSVILTTLPNVLKLDLSCNGMTMESFKTFAEVFKVSPRHDPNHKPPLSLRHLIVDHNPLGNGAIEQLVQIMKALQNLRVLSIVDCNLTAGFFSKNKREFANAMQVSRLETLDVSYNLLGNGGVQVLTLELAPATAQLNVITECCQ